MRRKTLLLGAGAVMLTGAVAVGDTLGLGGDDGSRPTDSADAHAGMVRGTVWVANEGGGSLTAIDAARNEVAANLSGVEGHTTGRHPRTERTCGVSGHDGRIGREGGDRSPQAARHGPDR